MRTPELQGLRLLVSRVRALPSDRLREAGCRKAFAAPDHLYCPLRLLDGRTVRRLCPDSCASILRRVRSREVTNSFCRKSRDEMRFLLPEGARELRVHYRVETLLQETPASPSTLVRRTLLLFPAHRARVRFVRVRTNERDRLQRRRTPLQSAL